MRAMLGLVDTPDPRYGGSPDPDEERERRWEPISLRIFLPAAGAVSCLILAGVTSPVLAFVLDAVALLLVFSIARAEWRARKSPPEV